MIEKIYDWCKFYNPYKTIDTYGIYDFILEDIKLIIETDGEWHRKDNNMSGQTKEESIFIDNEKDRLASEYNYKMIRVSDEGDVKTNILSSDISSLFNLCEIDWNECDEFALKNLVKIISQLKMLNPDWTTTYIANIMGINHSTVRKYLIKGNELNWCYYNGQQEKKKTNDNVYNLHIKNSKPIKMFDKDMNLIMMFFNARDCDKQSENMFGVKLNYKNISQVCKGEKKTHQGYIFKLATKEEYEQWLQSQK